MVSLTANFRANKTSNSPNTKWIPNVSKADLEGIATDMEKLSLEFQEFAPKHSVNESWTLFKDKIVKIWETRVPKRRCKNYHDKPWIDHYIKKLLAKKRRLRKKARSSRDPSDWNNFKIMQRSIKDSINNNKIKYLNGLHENMKANPKAFWRHLKRMRSTDNSIPDLKDGNILLDSPSLKAGLFNKTFKSVFHQQESNSTYEPEKCDETDTEGPLVITEAGVAALISKLPAGKAPGPDGITSLMLKKTLPCSAKILSILFNFSIEKGEVPEDWRVAAVVPIPKTGKRDDPSNYRPVSLTSIPCKLMEHIIVTNLYDFLEKRNLLSPQQFGFRRGASCELLLTYLCHRIAQWMDQGLQVELLLFDLQRAFDKVKHSHLFSKMKRMGISPNFINWFRSFLGGRKQFVRINSGISDYEDVTSGVPQGTVSGPLLFLIFINDLPQHLNSLSMLFADDTAMCRPIRGPDDHRQVQEDIDALAHWCKIWDLPLNANKTKLIRFTRKKAQNITRQNYMINGMPIEETENARYLGVILDQKFNWVKHISACCKKATQMLAFVSRNLKGTNRQAKEIATNLLVIPHLTYASAVWDPHTATQKSMLERIQRKSARTIFSAWDRHRCVRELMDNLGWINLEEKRREHRLKLFYDILSEQTVIRKDEILEEADYHARQDHTRKIKLFQTKNSFFRYSFMPRTTFEWNTLPADTVVMPTKNTFIRSLEKLRKPNVCRHLESGNH